MRSLLLPRSVLASLALLAAAARATTLIYPVSAIEDLWMLPAEDFRQRHGGINITGLGPSDEGWYVRYRHENLTYLFGPIGEREEARQRKWDLEAVRDAAIRHRATLGSSQIDYVRFSFSGIYGRGGEGTGGLAETARVSADGRSGPDGDLDGDGIPNREDPDMDGDGIPNDQDPDSDGDGIPDAQDDYRFGSNPNGSAGAAGGGRGGNGRDGPDGDLDGDGIPNRDDPDMDGDGIPNDQDPDSDGDGIPNGEDKYPFGRDDGPDGNSGSGRPAGGGDGRESRQSGGQPGQEGDGRDRATPGQLAGLGQPGQPAAGPRGAPRPGQPGQPGQPGGQSGSSQSSGSPSQGQGQPGQPGSPGGQPSSPGSSGSPIDLLAAVLRAILGL